jgi:hypothetical protein
MSLQQQRDTRHMVVPRLTEIHAHCLKHLANRALSLYAAVRRTYEEGEEAPELSEKLEETIMRFGEISGQQPCRLEVFRRTQADWIADQMSLQTKQLLALGQPDSRFLRRLLATAETMLKDDDTSFLNEPIHDWASLQPQDRLDQLITLTLTTDIGKKVAVSHPLCHTSSDL